MNETEWNSCTEPRKMLEWLRHSGKTTERKLRLFACACCRRIWHLLPDKRSQEAVEAGEKYADGLLDATSLPRVMQAASQATKGPFGVGPRAEFGACLHAAMAAWWVVNDAQAFDAEEVCNRTYGATVCDPDDPELEDAAQADLLRCLFGPRPLHTPLLDPAWLAWNDGNVRRLAATIYEERALPQGTLDRDHLAVLADALEEAGCDSQDILGHCRQQNAVHVRGCFVIDLLLSKQ